MSTSVDLRWSNGAVRNISMLLALCLISSRASFPQNKVAVVILKPAAGIQMQPCDDRSDLRFETVRDMKLNGKKEVRLAAGLSPSGLGDSISRADYDKTRTVKIADLAKIEWHNGVLHASSAAESRAVCLPSDLKLEKNSSRPLRVIYSTLFEGERADGKSRQKVPIRLEDIWKIYMLSEGEKSDVALFLHAREENNIGQWKAYLKITSTYKVDEAIPSLHAALMSCAKASLDRFRNGDYASIEGARKLAQDAQAVRADDSIRNLLTDIDREDEQVRTTIAAGIALYNGEKWDEALDTLKAVQKYAGGHPELTKALNASAKASHDLHVGEGKSAMGTNRFDEALRHFALALTRIADSGEARSGRIEAIARITLRDSEALRKKNRPSEARDLVAKTLGTEGLRDNPRLLEELRTASCEQGRQLYASARDAVSVPPVKKSKPPVGSGPSRSKPATSPLQPSGQATIAAVPALKPILTGSDKKIFTDARERLTQSRELCSDEATADLLTAVNERLSDYYLAQSRNALKRKSPATAYILLNTARNFSPERGEVHELIAQAQEQFELKTRIHVAVTIRDLTAARKGQMLTRELKDAIQGSLLESGGNLVVMEPAEAERLWKQSRAGAVDRPALFISGDISACDLRRTPKSTRVRATQQKINPRYVDLSNSLDSAKQQYNDCKRQQAEAACASARSRMDRLSSSLSQVQPYTPVSYTYSETSIVVSGAAKAALRMDDTLSRVTRQIGTLEAAVQRDCVERSGVREDESLGRWRDILSVGGTSVKNQTCDLADDAAYMQEMIGKLTADAKSKAAGALKDLRLGFFKRAQAATNPDLALEDYIVFAYLSRDKSGSEMGQALQFIQSRDQDLALDLVTR